MSDGMTTALQDKLRAALDKFPHAFRRTTPDPERLRPEFADTLQPSAHEACERLNQALDFQFGEILNVSIGK
jgi:hypothetical protein